MARQIRDEGISNGNDGGQTLTASGIRKKGPKEGQKCGPRKKVHKYTPDWVLPNGIIVESKGRFVTEDRTKHRLIREQYPHLDIRFVFSNANTKIGKKSATTYGLWCQRLGIPYATRSIPQAWIDELPHRARMKALEVVLG